MHRRPAAVTKGQIADVLQARGQLDEALRIRREEQLRVFEIVGDVREAAVTLLRIAAGLIEAEGLKGGHHHEINEALAEAQAISRQLGLPHGIAFVGVELPQVLLLGGLRQEENEVLLEAVAAFKALGHVEVAKTARALRERIDWTD